MKVGRLQIVAIAVLIFGVPVAIALACPPGRRLNGVRPGTTLYYQILGNVGSNSSCVVEGFGKWNTKNATPGGNGVRFEQWTGQVPSPNINVTMADLPAGTPAGITERTRDADTFITGFGILLSDDTNDLESCSGFKKATMHEAGHGQNLGDAFGSGGSVMNQFAGKDDVGGNIPDEPTDCDRNTAATQSNKQPAGGETPEEHFQRCAGDEENCDPIVLNLDGGGLRLSDPDVTFDILADGAPQTLSWTLPGAGDAFLALDRDNDGVITDGRELFGNVTPLGWTFAGAPARHGFEALEFFDQPANGGNGNGGIDSGDDVFRSLVVWVDANHDGITDAGETKGLAAAGIIRIDCWAKESSRRDGAGNAYRYRAPVQLELSGRRVTRYAYDVFLESR